MSPEARKMENDRSFSPVRGYPPLVREAPDTMFAVVGLMVIDDEEACLHRRIEDAAVRYVAELLSEHARVEPLPASGDMVLWCVYLGDDSGLLSRSMGLQLEYGLLRDMAEQVFAELGLMVQFIVSSVYSEKFDVAQAMDEVLALSKHSILLNFKNSVCGHRSADVEKQFPDAMVNNSRKKLDLEKLFFNSIITLHFPEACEHFLGIIDLELKSPETALFIKTRVCNRLAGVIYTLGSPPNHGKPLKNNVMASIDALAKLDSIEVIKDGVRDIFRMLEEDYCSGPHQTKLDQIAAYIQDNYQDCNLDATQICEAFELSPPSLSRMFRREKGVTMLDYVHTVRLGHVKEMMLKTDLSLQEIATQCGYYSFWTMSRAFKKYEGVNLSEYRRTVFESGAAAQVKF